MNNLPLLPSAEGANSALEALLSEALPDAAPVHVLARVRNCYTSTFPSECVTCEGSDGRRLRVLCKYEHDSGEDSHGHRGGVAHEAAVYRDVLAPLGATAPHFYGTFVDEITGRLGLVLEFVEDALRLPQAPAKSVVAAAAWIGRFHAAAAPLADAPAAPPLRRHPASYFAGWADRTLRQARRLEEDAPWLPALAERFRRRVARAFDGPLTVVHGEYYPKNILRAEGQIRPVDWESAAIAPGAVDVASLTEGWPENLVAQSEQAYVQARWPGAAPPGFARRLCLARMYFHFRWLGQEGAPPLFKEANAWRPRDLHALDSLFDTHP